MVSATVLALAPIALGAGLYQAGLIPGSADPLPDLLADGSDDEVILYVLWIGSDGQVLPVYPWRPGD